MAYTSNVAQKQNGINLPYSTGTKTSCSGGQLFPEDELQRELWLTQNRVDQAYSAVICASSIPPKESGLLSLFPLQGTW